MLDAIKPLLDSQLINESTGLAITEAFEAKLNEAREQVRAELREEFAQRYEHDKSVMVEALDRMVTEGLTAELQEFQEERRGLNEDRVRFQVKMKESADKHGIGFIGGFISPDGQKFIMTNMDDDDTQALLPDNLK
jgi:hypothetical protein